ncbi:hypothetical protein DIPPA_22694, partial [Diplonema papillatum]
SGIKPVNPDLLAGSNIELDVVPDKNTAFAPSIDRQTYRPVQQAPPPAAKPGKKGAAKQPAAAVSDEERVRKSMLFNWLFPSMTTKEYIRPRQSLLIPHNEALDDTQKRAAKIFVRNKTGEPRSGTAGSNIELDVVPDKDTAFAPSIDRQTYRPVQQAPPPAAKPGKKGAAKQPAAAVSDEERVRKSMLFNWLFPSMTTKESGIKPVNPDLLTGTAGSNIELDVVPDKDTAFAPSIDRQTYRPVQQAPPPAAKPGKKGAAKQPAAAGVGDEERVRKSMLFNWLFPSMTTKEKVPSITRMRQVRGLQRVRDALAKNRVHVTIGELEQGLLTPEYQPYLDCISNLPTRDQGFASSWERAAATKSKGKAKGKSPKKKAKKKGKR